jgi:hypothetical protein
VDCRRRNGCSLSRGDDVIANCRSGLLQWFDGMLLSDGLSLQRQFADDLILEDSAPGN